MLLDEFGQSLTYHEEEGKVYLKYHTPDVSPVLEANARARTDSAGLGRKGDLRRIMSIPNAVLLKLNVERGLDFMDPEHWPTIMGILSGPDYAMLRTVDKF